VIAGYGPPQFLVSGFPQPSPSGREACRPRCLPSSLGRLVSLALSLLAASIVIFLVLEVVPGDPAQFMLGLNATPEAAQTLRETLGLERPPVERYFGWLFGLLRGDFGISATPTRCRCPG
jgi:ABC-type dipeptide/oligopeptide/nickel transport system permease component